MEIYCDNKNVFKKYNNNFSTPIQITLLFKNIYYMVINNDDIKKYKLFYKIKNSDNKKK